MTKFDALLKQLGACAEARQWAKGKSFADVWNTCERGDWLLWLCARMIGKDGWPTYKTIVLAACNCAELALKHVKPGENRPRIAIETARKWTKGDATIEEVRTAADAADAAADAADAAAAAAAYAAYAADADAATAAAAAAYAADAADAATAAAAAAAAYAADAAYAAYAAYAAAAAATAARIIARNQCAVIVRSTIPMPDFEVRQ